VIYNTASFQDHLSQICSDFASRNVDADNAVDCLNLALRLDLLKLKKVALSYIGFHFDQIIIKCPCNVGNLSSGAVSALASCPQLRKTTEDDVFRMVETWKEKNVPDDARFKELLEYIDPGKLTSECLELFTSLPTTTTRARGQGCGTGRHWPKLLLPVTHGCVHMIQSCEGDNNDDDDDNVEKKFSSGALERIVQSGTLDEDDVGEWLPGLEYPSMTWRKRALKAPKLGLRYFGRGRSVLVAATGHRGRCECGCRWHFKTANMEFFG
jgi:hypothetical protein